MRRVLCVLAVAFLAVTAVSAEKVSLDDVINMAKQGVGEDVLMAAVERSDDAYNLTAQEILKLKAAGVSEKVIAAMLRKKGAAMPPPMPPPADKAGEQPVVVGAAQGKLNIENVDDLPWAYRLDPNSKAVSNNHAHDLVDQFLGAAVLSDVHVDFKVELQHGF